MADAVDISGNDNPYPLAVDNLKLMRAMLVEQRRTCVSEGLHAREVNGEGGERGAQIKQLQEQIEAVDRAIEDEKKLKGSIYTKATIG